VPACHGTVVIGIGIIRAQPNGLGEIGHSGGKVAETQVRVTKSVIGGRKLRIDGDRTI
jgi:hypothetical protein